MPIAAWAAREGKVVVTAQQQISRTWAGQGGRDDYLDRWPGGTAAGAASKTRRPSPAVGLALRRANLSPIERASGCRGPAHQGLSTRPGWDLRP